MSTGVLDIYFEDDAFMRFISEKVIHLNFLLNSLNFSNNDILKILKLDPNKAHVHDMISFRMVKFCDDSICKPLKLIFQSYLKNGKFRSEWRKANVFPIHKKDHKQILKVYRPISLYPVTGKIFERLLYDRMFELKEKLYRRKLDIT